MQTIKSLFYTRKAGNFSTLIITFALLFFVNSNLFGLKKITNICKIIGENPSNYLGDSMAKLDINNNGIDDLIVTAWKYNSEQGRLYIFYDTTTFTGTINASSADLIITGSSNSGFGSVYGNNFIDLNNDGRKDLVVAGVRYATNTGRIHIFYNDGSIPTLADNADIIITGESSWNYFGNYFAPGGADFNNDGKPDLVVAASGWYGYTGKLYIFYNDGAITNLASGADVKIKAPYSGFNFGNCWGYGAYEDYNNDGKNDFVVGNNAQTAGSNLLIFYGGKIPSTNAMDADVKIYCGDARTLLLDLDVNNDGKKDIIIGQCEIESGTQNGKVYIIYNDGNLPSDANNADIIINPGTTGARFGHKIEKCGDIDGDGTSELIISSVYYATNRGRVTIYYCDGDIPTNETNADITLIGENINDLFGNGILDLGDINSDGNQEFAISAYHYNGGQGCIYIYSIISETTPTVTEETKEAPRYDEPKVEIEDDFVEPGEEKKFDLGINLNKAGRVTIEVYDIQGNLVDTICRDKQFDRGYHHIRWEVKQALGSGVYWVIMRGEGWTKRKRVAIVK